MRLCSFIALCAAAAPAFAAPPNMHAMLDRMGGADANRDGNITKPELVAFRAANFARIDRDRNGVLTKSDIPAFAARLNRNLDFDAMIGQFDANRDGQVSRAEFVTGQTAVFDAADTNRDNVLTTVERNAALANTRR